MSKRKGRPPVKEGATFIKVYGGVEYKMTVIKDGEIIKYKVGENLFSTPTAAAKFVKQSSVAVNGWVFWRMDK